MIRITYLVEIFTQWLLALQNLWSIIISPMSTYIEPLLMVHPGFLALGSVLKLMGVYNLTLLEFMLGSGLILYLGYQLLIWVFNLVN